MEALAPRRIQQPRLKHVTLISLFLPTKLQTTLLCLEVGPIYLCAPFLQLPSRARGAFVVASVMDSSAQSTAGSGLTTIVLPSNGQVCRSEFMYVSRLSPVSTQISCGVAPSRANHTYVDCAFAASSLRLFGLEGQRVTDNSAHVLLSCRHDR